MKIHEDNEDILLPAGVGEGMISADESVDILYPAGVGPAGEDADNESDDGDILLPIMDR